MRDAYSGTQPMVEVRWSGTGSPSRGLTVDAVANALAGGLGGVAASEFRETDRRTPIRVRFAGSANEDLATALATPVRGVPVGQLVLGARDTRSGRGRARQPAAGEVIEAAGGARRHRARDAAIDAGARRSCTCRPASPGRSPAPTPSSGAPRASWRWWRFSRWRWCSWCWPASSPRSRCRCWSCSPCRWPAAGGIVFLWITGQSLNAVSLIGIVVMIGMADNEAVVKLDAIRRFREQGHPIDEAVLLGGRQRLRAIAMTSITTITGVLPLVFGWGSGGELYQPLAAGVIGGSVSATLVTFFLLPTAYAVVERGRAQASSAVAIGQPPSRPPSIRPMISWAARRPAVIWAFAVALILAGGVALHAAAARHQDPRRAAPPHRRRRTGPAPRPS